MFSTSSISIQREARRQNHRPTRISTFCAPIFLSVPVVVFGDFVGMIPIAALVAAMIMLAVGAFDWHSVMPSTLKRMPKSETFAMVTTVPLKRITHDLAVAVAGGVLIDLVLNVGRVAHVVSVSRTLSDDGGSETYVVYGGPFIASSDDAVHMRRARIRERRDT